MDRLTGTRSPTKDNTSAQDNNGVQSMRNSPSASSAMPTRSGTVSWQQRPKSRAGRALSIIASENAAEKLLRSTPEPARSRPTSSHGEPIGRDAIAQSLGSKTPDFFRQSAESGRGSGAFRKNQVEDSDTVEGHTGGQRMQLPGMADSGLKADAGRSLSPSRSAYGESTPSGRPTSSHGHSSYKRGSIAGFEDEAARSRASTLTGGQLPPPSATDGSREPTMSPAQGRISPERNERPASPTKGMGGFVQSAMMKRNDSVNKRWSVQSPSMPPRTSSSLNRQSVDLGSIYASPRDRPISQLSRETTSELSRPSSSHSNTTYTTRDADQSRPTSSYYEQPSSDSPTKSHPVLDPYKESFDDLSRPETPRPLSPTKTGGDKPRWSPTKSSWLESALLKPESPKVRPAAPAAQPSWMEGISKAKLNPEQEPTNGAAKVEAAPTLKHRHQVSIEGLIRSPGMGASEKPKNISALAAKFSSGVGSPAEKRKESFRDERPSGRNIIEARKKSFANLDAGALGIVPLAEKKPSLTSLKSENKPFMEEPAAEKPVKKASIESVEPVRSEEPVARSITPKAVEAEEKPSQAPLSPAKSKFEPRPLEAGKFDFRGNLKPKVPPPSTSGTNEPEFKNVFGQLRRTKTQKYEAPDVLKDNILRGKSGLAQTGGPQKTERKDEFKEAILQKKKAFEKAKEEGTAVGLVKTPSQIQKELPEALLKKAALGRSGSTAKIVDVPSREPSTIERPKRPEQLPFRERAKSFAKLDDEQRGLGRTPSTISMRRDASPAKDENTSTTAAPLGVGRSYSTKRVDDVAAISEAIAPETSPEKSDAQPRHRRAKSISAKVGMFERQQPEAPVKKPSFEVPKRTIVQKDEFGPPLRRQTEQPNEEPSSFVKPSLMKEESAPGRMQAKIAAGNKLAERFNPALANLLARGPPAPGSESPVKSTSTASAPVTKNTASGEATEGPKLDHKTKSRARGPKRKAPSTAAAAIAVPSEIKPAEPTEEAPKPRPLPVPHSQPLKDEQTRDTPSLRSRFMEEAKPAQATEQTIADAGTPRKLNIKRRSQFLAGGGASGPATPVKGDFGANHQRDSVAIEKRSPAKNDLAELPSQRTSIPPKDDRRNFSPTVKPKPLSLVSPPIDSSRFESSQRVMTPPSKAMSPSNKSFGLGNFDFETTKAASPEEQRRPSVASVSSSEHSTYGNQAKQDVSSQRQPSVMSSIASPPQDARRYEMPPPAPAPVTREPTRVTSPPPRTSTLGTEYKPYSPNPAGRKISNTSEASYNNDKVDSESISSVKSTKSMFGREASQARSDNVQRTPSVKAPIKLPTLDDENEAMIKAGLRSPSSDSYRQMQQDMYPALSRTSTREQQQHQQPQQAPKEFAHMREASRELPQPPQREQSYSPILARQPFQSSGRPLPIPPLRISKTPPPAVPQPLSPTKSVHRTGSLLSPRTDTSKTLQEFFNNTDVPKNVNIDTGAIIEMRPDYNSPIHTLSAAIYQIGQDGKKQSVPRGQERTLFEGNMYLCTHVFTRPKDPNHKITEVYFWIGDEVPETLVYDAEVMAMKETRAVRGELVKLRQGKETPEFIDALEGIIVVHRGVAHRFDATRPMMLCARSYAGRIVFDEVDYSPLSLCSGYPYIVSTSSGKCYLWKGRGAGVDELSSARLIGMDYGMTGEIIEVEDGRESQYFLDEFGRGTIIYKSAEHWRLKPLYELYSTRLFVADSKATQKVRSSLSSQASMPPPSPSSWSPMAFIRSRANTPEPRTEADEPAKHQIVEIAPFRQTDMDPRYIYVLDAFFELYIIVGKESQDKYDDFCAALVFAQEYGILTAGMEDRPFVPVSTVVLEGVPRDMKGVFRKWRDVQSPLIMKPRTLPQQGGSMGGSLKRGKSLRVVRLNDALDAVRL